MDPRTLWFADSGLERRFLLWRGSRLAQVRWCALRGSSLAAPAPVMGCMGAGQLLPPSVRRRGANHVPPCPSDAQLDSTALVLLLAYHFGAECLPPPAGACTGWLPALTVLLPLLALLLLLNRSRRWYSKHRWVGEPMACRLWRPP